MSNELKATVGPWKVRFNRWTADISGDGVGIAHIYDGVPRDKVKANAHMIAASPDLYEALCDMVSDRESLSEATIENARKALAKARGES